MRSSPMSPGRLLTVVLLTIALALTMVAGYTVSLAQVADRAEDGPFRNVRFTPEQIREIKYAGLLHDFGKVGVREQVLVKAKKLYPRDLELIRQRHAFILRTAWIWPRTAAVTAEGPNR